MLCRMALVLMCMFSFLAPASYAVFDAQLLLGQRSAKIQPEGAGSSTGKGQVVKLAGHLDPIPLVPVAFGVSAAQVDFKDDFEAGSSFKGTEIGVEVMAWVPLDLWNINPYGKLGYTVLGAYTMDTEDDGNDIKAVYTPNGLNFAIGLKWSPLPLVGFLLEFDNGSGELKEKETKVNGEKFTGDKTDFDSSHTDILVGVQVGL
ncbi:MAG: outer membrane beta-barrel protein [Oligoflexales bacterium]